MKTQKHDVYTYVNHNVGEQYRYVTITDVTNRHVYYAYVRRDNHIGRMNTEMFLRIFKRVDRLTKLIVRGKGNNHG